MKEIDMEEEQYYRCLQSPPWSNFDEGQVTKLKGWELETFSSSGKYKWEPATEKEYLMYHLS